MPSVRFRQGLDASFRLCDQCQSSIDRLDGSLRGLRDLFGELIQGGVIFCRRKSFSSLTK